MEDDKRDNGFGAYPKPTETDQQLRNQPEYIDQQPNDFADKSVSDIPNTNYDRNTNDPERDTQQTDE